jgi:hypothetical protein
VLFVGAKNFAKTLDTQVELAKLAALQMRSEIEDVSDAGGK